MITDGDLSLGKSGAHRRRTSSPSTATVGWPSEPDHPDFADYLYWFHFANGSFMPAGMTEPGAGDPGLADQEAVKPLLARGDRAYAMSRGAPGKGQVVRRRRIHRRRHHDALSPDHHARLRSRAISRPYPNIRAYLARIGERPAFQRAAKKGDPDLVPLLS